MFSNFFQRQNNNSGIPTQLIETLIQNALNETLQETENHGISEQMLQSIRSNATNIENEENVTQCSVCLENINVGDSCVTLRCNHKFHLHCIERWCQTHNTCPMCRNEIEQQEAQNTQRTQTQRIIVNNISHVQMTIAYEGISFNTFWSSTSTIIDIFNYFERMHQNYTRLMLQVGNRFYKTTESYELLAQTLSQHGIVGHVTAQMYNC
jgi:hypothetical protein